jgi:hypothetical protein
MQTLLYIASLPHSGSTLLDLLLGGQPSMIGIGGVDRAVSMLVEKPQETAQRTCSCGARVPACPYWGAVLARIGAGECPRDLPGRYRLALGVFAETFGSAVVPVDSSKVREPLLQLRGAGLRDVRVIHLAKDFRAASVSYVENKRRKGALRHPAWISSTVGAWKWHRENRKIEMAIAAAGWPRLGLGYESPCLRPSESLAAITRFAGLPAHAPSPPADLRHTASHLFIGNRMRNDSAPLAYDARWMTRRHWMPAALLMPWLHHANKRWVHKTETAD